MEEKILQQILAEIQGLKNQVSENTNILKSIEHKVEVLYAEKDSNTHKIASIEGKVQSHDDFIERLREAVQ